MTPEQLKKMQEGRKAAGKRPSMRKAINLMCKTCIYDPGNGNGTWRQQTEACGATSCPLWELRPRSTGVDNDDDEPAEPT